MHMLGLNCCRSARRLGLSLSLPVALVLGCTFGPEPTGEEIDLRVGGDSDPIYHTWSNVLSVEATGQRNAVGFLDRRFSDADREGITFVLDREHREKGFFLPGGKAFRFLFDGEAPKGHEDLGHTGLESGVKQILGVTGAIAVEEVPSRT